jgi:hypothetical protein
VVHLPVGAGFNPLPRVLLTLLGGGWGLAVALAARRRADGSTPHQLGALAASVALAPEFGPPTWTWRVAPEAALAAEEAVQRVGVPPTVTIAAHHRLVALWGLREPLPLSRESARATAVLRALAAACDAPFAGLEDLRVPVPGSVVRNAGDPPPRVAVASATRNRYSIDDIERALGRALRKE